MPVELHINAETLNAQPGPSLFDCAEQVGVRVPTSCHKNGKCRECLLEIAEGMDCLSPKTEEEKHLQDNFRLACQTHIVSTSGTVRCHTMRCGKMLIVDSATGLGAEGASRELDPAITREGSTILLEGQAIANSQGPLLGLAIDVGTTTIVIRLVDLEAGQIVETQAFENPQRFGGSDIMARIKYDTDHKGRLLQRTLLGYLSHAVEAFDCDPQSIYEAVVVGNPTMRDLLFGLDVNSLGQRPYHSITQHEMEAGKRDSTTVSTTAKSLRLPIHPQARVQGLTLVHGHVGADAAAGLLAIALGREDRLVAMMDIGTNTEFVVGNRYKIMAASCPAGPAFEGGAITCGMPALEGAIESVRIADDGTISCRVIGGGPPQGICGSGLVDVLSELLRTGRMNELGRLTDESDRFVLDAENNVFVSEKDISQLAQAKGANVAGLHIVLNRLGIDAAQLHRFFLAGGFARRLDISAARRVGLIPDLPEEKFVQIGNAAIEGATRALLSMTRRRELEELAQRIVHVELETEEQFFEYFTEGCLFGPVQATHAR